jgi:hypothetical protein
MWISLGTSERKKPLCVEGGGRCCLFKRYVVRFGEPFSGETGKGGFASFASVRFGGHIRAIRLDHDLRKGDLCRDCTGGLSFFKGKNSGKRDQKVELSESGREGCILSEAMKNTSYLITSMLLNESNAVFTCLAGMDDERFTDSTGELNLANKPLLLSR